jgi:hypothetical protein
MNTVERAPLDLSIVMDRLALGLDLFGPFAPLIWSVITFWVTIGLSLWAYAAWQQHLSDRAYLAYVARHLPILRRIAEQRVCEIGASRRNDRF